ncbi:MAG: hypothetical protein ACJA0Q_002121 [Saprospiraceae bacterium]|jgi:hypothetical protein
MKNSHFQKATIVIILLVGFIVFPKTTSAKEYRIEYVSELDDNFLYDLNKVEGKKIYILPNGAKLYFTPVTFSSYSSAQKELKRLRDIGFTSPKIRAFHNNKICAEIYVKENKI